VPIPFRVERERENHKPKEKERENKPLAEWYLFVKSLTFRGTEGDKGTGEFESLHRGGCLGKSGNSGSGRGIGQG